MKTSPHPPTRACPDCAGATERVARTLPDRALNLLMPVKRYRCQARGCGWEGLLLSRRPHRAGPGPARKPAAEAVVTTDLNRSPALIAFRTRAR